MIGSTSLMTSAIFLKQDDIIAKAMDWENYVILFSPSKRLLLDSDEKRIKVNAAAR